jgi:hypothetical protein
MTKDFQIISVTSSPFKRVFNYINNLVIKKRTRIISENIRYILYLKSWGFIVDNDDEVEIVFNENKVRIKKEALIVFIIIE